VNIAEFKRHIAERIEASIRNCESSLGCTLPRNLAFRWISPEGSLVTDAIEDEVARVAFENDERIYPCIDIGPMDIDDTGRLIVVAIRAGYAPRPFGPNWKGEPGPFILIYSSALQAKVA
jgi:hypothetical protein